MWETRVGSLGGEDPLEKEMATHSSTLAWKIPWTEEPRRLPSMGSQRVRHNWVTSLSLYSLLQEGYGLIIFAHPGLVRPTLGSSPQDRDQIPGLEDSEGDSGGSPRHPALWPGHGQPYLGAQSSVKSLPASAVPVSGKEWEIPQKAHIASSTQMPLSWVWKMRKAF